MINPIGYCTFPLCKLKDTGKGFCLHHAKYFAPPKEKKKPKPIPKKSAKRKKDDAVYLKMVKKASEISNECEVKSPDCTGKMQGFNHKQKRSPNNLLKKENLERSCNACNLYCETHPVWAKQNGHFISRFKK